MLATTASSRSPSAGRRLSQRDLEVALATFDGLSRETARRVVKFYEQRRKRSTGEASAALAASA
jgi:hypothetical protein